MAYTTTNFRSSVPGTEWKVYLEGYFAGWTPLSRPLTQGFLAVGAGYLTENVPFIERSLMLGVLDGETVLLPNIDLVSGPGFDIWPIVIIVSIPIAGYILAKLRK